MFNVIEKIDLWIRDRIWWNTWLYHLAIGINKWEEQEQIETGILTTTSSSRRHDKAES